MLKRYPTSILLLTLLAGFLNILPRIFLPPGSDVLVHYALIDCFSRQLWEGNLYPRWCIDGNAGLGGSDFLFYFPLPYYITALFYPLKSLIGVEGLYLCGLFAASAAAFAACRCWLADVAGEKIASAGAFLFLWLPYRSELLYYRSAYPELCEVALLPRMFLWLRRAASNRKAGWPALAALVALMFFTHVPTALIALGAGSLYLLLLAPRALLSWIIGVTLGLAIAAIYAVPAEHFLPFLNPEALEAISHEWSGGFLTLANFLHQPQAALAAGTGLLTLGLLTFAVMTHRRNIGEDFTRRETTAWCIIAAVFFFLLLPASAPVWAVIKAALSVAATPWRVQVVLTFALIYLFAVHVRWLTTARAVKFARGNYALLVGFFVLMSLFAATMPANKPAIITAMKNIHWMGIARYSQTRWTDSAHSNVGFLLTESKRKEPRVEIVRGKGSAEVRQWGDDGIVIEAKLREKSLLRIRQFYFPLWHAAIDGRPAELAPQEHTGRMLIAVPAGDHRIFVYTSLAESLPLAWPLAKMISLIAALIVISGLLRQQYFDKRATTC